MQSMSRLSMSWLSMPLPRVIRRVLILWLSPERIAQDPDDPSTYYLATANDGVYRITDRRLTGRYDGSNAPLEDHYGWRVYDLSFDRSGNLWMGSTSEGGDA